MPFDISNLLLRAIEVLVVYYSLLILSPPKKWPYFIEHMDVNKRQYFRSHRIVFDCEKAKFPASQAKTVFAVSPHGILGLGWMCLVSIELCYIDSLQLSIRRAYVPPTFCVCSTDHVRGG